MKRFAFVVSLTLALALVAALVLGRARTEAHPERKTILAGPPIAAGEPLRFVVLGDQGKGNDKQFAVARSMKSVCERLGGCAFAVTVGDNFYPTGVESDSDPQWESKFMQPYGDLPFDFYPALGNHDYGGDGGGWEFWRAEAQLSYAKKNPKWKMPGRYYAFNSGPVDLFVLDTTEFFWGRVDEQRAVFQRLLSQSKAPWRIVAGHHPLLSNGPHGNAGAYDKVPFGLPASGVPVKLFLENEVCGKVHLYAAGHDHNLQDLVSPCPTELVVSGAGANTTRLRGSELHHFQSSESGFLVVTATDDELVLSFFDSNAQQLHTRTIRKTKDN